jgi:hypothetical protein
MLEVVRFYRFLSGNCPHILHCTLFELSLLHCTELKNMLLAAQHQELFNLRKTFEDCKCYLHFPDIAAVQKSFEKVWETCQPVGRKGTKF